jgi:hypothetical protein
MAQCTTVQRAIGSAPANSQSLPGTRISATNIRRPKLVDRTTRITSLFAIIAGERPQVLLTELADGQKAIITARQIFDYLAAISESDSSGIALTDETVEDLVLNVAPPLVDHIDHESTTQDVLARFFRDGEKPADRPQFLLVTKEKSILGVIQNPIVKYSN